MGHREPSGGDLAAVRVDDAPARRLVGPPAAGGVRGPVGGQIASPAVLHRQPVEVATVLARQCGDELRLPARDETELVAEGTEAGEQRVDEPELVADPGHLVGVDLAGDVRGAGQVAGVVLPGRLDPRGQLGRTPEEPDLATGADGDPRWADGDPHHLLEAVERTGQGTLVGPEDQELARLVGRDQEAGPEPIEHFEEAERVLEPDGRQRRLFGGRRRFTHARSPPMSRPGVARN